MINRINVFFKHGYNSDPVAFMLEMISFIFTVGASTVLAFTADAPDMRIVYPFFLIGSVTAAYANYRRKLAWPMLVTTYFIGANIFGFMVAMRYI